MVSVKICGLTSESDVVAAIDSGADYVGFVLAPASPRHVPFETAQALIRLAAELGAEPWVVAAVDTPGLDKLVGETPEIAVVQLHGKETPGDVAAFARRHPLTAIVKAIGVSSRKDLELAEHSRLPTPSCSTPSRLPAPRDRAASARRSTGRS